MPPPEILRGLILVAVCHLFFGFLVLWFAQEVGGRLGRIAGRGKSDALAGAILWTLLLVGVFVLHRSFSTGIDGGGAVGQALSVLLQVVLLSPLGCLTPLVGRYLKKLRDPIMVSAQKLSRGGDYDGAIAILRNRIEAGETTADRLNHLGFFYCLTGDHEEALDMFRGAEKLGGPRPFFSVNQAAALRGLGLFEESISLLDSIPRRGMPGLMAFYCHCHTLADLGRIEEARDQLRRADRLGRSFIRRSAREVGANLLRECRERLDGPPATVEAAEADGLSGGS